MSGDTRRAPHDGPPGPRPAVYAAPTVNRSSDDRQTRKVKNEHGTRVARAITCARCGAKDTVHFAPRRADRTLCRKCAAEVLGVSDEDAGIRPERVLVCIECSKEERTTFTGEEDAFKCRDCARGIWSQQKDRGKSAERVDSTGRVLRVRRDGGTAT